MKFQSAPVFITPGNGPTWASGPYGFGFQSAPVFITPGNAVEVRQKVVEVGVSIRPGVHHTGEPRPGARRGRGDLLFQSAPVFITPGNDFGAGRQGEVR